MPDQKRLDVRLPKGTKEQWPGAPGWLERTEMERILFDVSGVRTQLIIGDKAAEKVLKDLNVHPVHDLNSKPDREIEKICVKFVDDNQNLVGHLARAFKSEERRLEIRQALRKLMLITQSKRRERWIEAEAMKSLSRDTTAVETPVPGAERPPVSIWKNEALEDAVREKNTIEQDPKVSAGLIPPVATPVLDDMAMLDILVYDHGSDKRLTRWSPLLKPLLGNQPLELADEKKLWEALWKMITLNLRLDLLRANRTQENCHLWSGACEGEVKGDYISDGASLKGWLMLCAKNRHKLVVILVIGRDPDLCLPEPPTGIDAAKDGQKSTSSTAHDKDKPTNRSKRSIAADEEIEPAAKRNKSSDPSQPDEHSTELEVLSSGPAPQPLPRTVASWPPRPRPRPRGRPNQPK